MVRVIGALCVYNEADMIASALDSCLKLGIIDIHIMDGPWEGTGYTETKSTDGTIEAVSKWHEAHPYVGVTIIQGSEIYRSEGLKRNKQLALIAQMAHDSGEEEYSVFVIDGDEEVRFPNGLERMTVGKLLDGRADRLGMVECFAARSDKALWTPRIFPAERKFHYHTECNMMVHDQECKLVCSYDPERWQNDASVESYISNFFIVNKWSAETRVLDDNRMKAKAAYYQLQKERKANPALYTCRWQVIRGIMFP